MNVEDLNLKDRRKDGKTEFFVRYRRTFVIKKNVIP